MFSQATDADEISEESFEDKIKDSKKKWRQNGIQQNRNVSDQFLWLFTHIFVK